MTYRVMGSTLKHWETVSRVAERTGELADVFQSSPQTPAVIAGMLRGVSDIPDWLSDAASSTADPGVASAVLERSSDLPAETLSKLLSVKNEKVARVFAASDLVASLPAEMLDLFIYSNSQKVRSALVGNDNVATEHRMESLLGRTPDGEPIARLRTLDWSPVLGFLKSLGSDQLQDLTSSAFPEVLLWMLGSKAGRSVDPASIVSTALDGLEVCMSRRTRGPQVQLKIAEEYMTVLRRTEHQQHVPFEARGKLGATLDEAHKETRTEDGKPFTVIRYRLTWPVLDRLDFTELRTLVPALSTRRPLLASTSHVPDLRELKTNLEGRSSISSGEACEVLGVLASFEDKFQLPDIERIVRSIVARVAPRDLEETLEESSRLFPQLRVHPDLAEASQRLTVPVAARYFSLRQVLSWPAADVAAWISGQGLTLSELLALDSELGGSSTASELSAVLAP